MKSRRIDDDGNPSYGHGADDFVTDHEAVVQNVGTRLDLNRGDFFLDTDAGTPWLGQADAILGSPPARASQRAAVKTVILETEGVSALLSFDESYSSADRKMRYTADVATDFDQTSTVEVTQ